MFNYTSGTLEKIFNTGSYYEQSSVSYESQAFSSIRKINNELPLCKVIGVDGKHVKISDASHEASTLISSDSNFPLTVGSVILINEYSLCNKNTAFKQFELTDFDLQKGPKAVSNEFDHVLVITGFQLIGTDLPLKPDIASTSVDEKFLIISSLRPNIMKTCIRFKACLTQKGKNKTSVYLFKF